MILPVSKRMARLVFVLLGLVAGLVHAQSRNFTDGHKLRLLSSNRTTGNDRIVGGKPADEKHADGVAMVYIYDAEFDEYYQSCTGTIIGKRWILSAAHCFQFLGTGWAKFGAAPGLKNASIEAAQIQGIFAKKLWIHKKYLDLGLDNNFDIAVMELEEDIPTQFYMQVLLSKPPSDNTVVTAVGYGVLSEQLEEPDFVMMTDVVYREFPWCISNEKIANSPWHDGTYPLEERMLCAVSKDWPDGKTDTCYGDSGGPLFLKGTGNKLYQFAITSFSTTGCASYGGTPWYVNAWKYEWEVHQLIEGNPTIFRSYHGDQSMCGSYF